MNKTSQLEEQLSQDIQNYSIFIRLFKTKNNNSNYELTNLTNNIIKKLNFCYHTEQKSAVHAEYHINK